MSDDQQDYDLRVREIALREAVAWGEGMANSKHLSAPGGLTVRNVVADARLFEQFLRGGRRDV